MLMNTVYLIRCRVFTDNYGVNMKIGKEVRVVMSRLML